MKSTSQTAILLGALVAVVFVVTFLSQWVSSGDKPNVTGPKDGRPTVDANAKKLEFPQTAANDSFLVEMSPETGSYDFWFKNPHDKPIEVALESKSCKCASVKLTTLTTSEEQEYRNAPRYAAAQVLAAAANPLAGIGTTAAITQRHGFCLPGERWQALGDADPDKALPVVPPHATGFLRVGWDGKAHGNQRLKAAIFMNAKGEDSRSSAILEVAVQFSPALNVSPASVDLNTPIREGKSASGSFYCWSLTRAGFHLDAHAKDNDPCFECETIAIDPEDVQHLAGKDAPPIRTAYRVKVTVHSNRGGRSLDLGPFAHDVEVHSDSQAQFSSVVRVSGAIEGNIRVASESGRDLINLEDFKSAKGVSKDVTLEADNDVSLTLESKAPSYLGVKLNEAPRGANGKKQWLLKVTIPADRADGKMPTESGVVLKTDEKPPRRIRIPVRGHASN
jgi:hypothetical protein